jgi:hypothetical protein
MDTKCKIEVYRNEVVYIGNNEVQGEVRTKVTEFGMQPQQAERTVVTVRRDDRSPYSWTEH